MQFGVISVFRLEGLKSDIGDRLDASFNFVRRELLISNFGKLLRLDSSVEFILDDFRIQRDWLVTYIVASASEHRSAVMKSPIVLLGI